MRLTGLFLALMACRSAPPDSDAPKDGRADSGGVDTPHDTAAASGVEHVVVVVLDGLRLSESFGDGTSDASGTPTSEILPAMRERLLPEGTLVTHGYATGIPITGPGHCDLLTGIRSDYGHFPTPAGAGRYRPVVPTLFEALAAQIPPADAPLVLTGNTDHIEALNRSVYPGVTDADGAIYTLLHDPSDDTKPEPNDPVALATVKDRLLAEHPRLTVVNLHAIDLAGHVAPDPLTYVGRAHTDDEPVTELWEWIQSPESGLADTTAMIVLADHGRHRWGAEASERLAGLEPPDYRHHGDQCAGCREIPMFFVGPGIRKGASVTTPYVLEDVGRTVAWMLGAPLPYASGIVMSDLFEDPPDDGDRAGVYQVDASGGSTAVQRWSEDSAHRAQIEVDGEALSAPADFLSEAPRVLVAGDTTYACWREFVLRDDTEIDWPWQGACKARTGGVWTDMAFPYPIVSPLWQPSLLTDAAGRLLMAWVDNPNSTTYSEDRARVRLERWSPAAGWEGAPSDGVGSAFPGPVSVTRDGDDLWVAWAESDMSPVDSADNAPGRYTRHVEVEHVTMAEDGTQTWTELWRTTADACPAGVVCPDRAPTLDTEGRAYGRAESAAIDAQGDTLRVAWIGWDADGSHLLLATSTDRGATWGTPERVDSTGRVFGQVAPRWLDGRLYWTHLGATGEAEACRLAPGGTAACIGLGSPRVASLAPTTTGAVASVDGGEGAWALQEVAW